MKFWENKMLVLY